MGAATAGAPYPYYRLLTASVTEAGYSRHKFLDAGANSHVEQETSSKKKFSSKAISDLTTHTLPDNVAGLSASV